MSTDYYLKLHLGKTHAGPGGRLHWTWDVNGHINDSELRRLLTRRDDAEISDEYGNEVTGDELMDILKEAVIRYSDRTFS